MNRTPASLALAALLCLTGSSALAGEPGNGVGEPDAPAAVLAAAPAAPALMVEAESAEAGDDWRADADVAGFAGDAYLRWTGGTALQPGERAVATFTVELAQAGRWQVRLRHCSTPAPGRTSSALWVAVDDGPWRSVALEPSATWSWATLDAEDAAGGPPVFELDAGEHELRLAGHTPGVLVDRFLLQPVDHPALADTRLAATPDLPGAAARSSGAWAASLTPARFAPTAEPVTLPAAEPVTEPVTEPAAVPAAVPLTELVGAAVILAPPSALATPRPAARPRAGDPPIPGGFGPTRHGPPPPVR